MNCEDYKYLIQEYHDGELKKGSEPLMFTHLSSCSECRDFFKTLNLIGVSVKEEIETFSLQIDKKIYGAILSKHEKNYSSILSRNVPAYIPYLLGILLISISIMFFNSSSSYKDDLHATMNILKEQSRLVNDQNKQIQLILNSLPEINVSTKLKSAVVIDTKL